MISFNFLDYTIVIGFLIAIVIIGLFAAKGTNKSNDDYLLSGRKVGIVLFVLTNVATWYGGILGVGEFSFRYGLVSWFTQGLPYYIFALVFAFFFAAKIKSAELYTIPDKLEEVYGKKVALISSILIFILVSPAPYLLILGQILALVFEMNYLYALLLSVFVSSIYLFKGGYKSNVWADAFSFFIMFIGFIVIVFVASNNYGGIEYLSSALPRDHLTLTGGTSITFVAVWFLIALWTFTDPGFHQRCYSAKSGKVAKWGIVISVFFWLIFDFLTNTTGLYSKAILPNLENPVLAFPYLANEILSPGLKGLFFAALIATVLSTLNSFLFLSATTFSRDFIFRLRKSRIGLSFQHSLDQHLLRGIFSFLIRQPSKDNDGEKSLVYYTKLGLIFALVISLVTAYYFESVVQLWYTIGSICIPGIILLVISSYYPKLRVNKNIALYEIIIGVLASLIWLIIRNEFIDYELLYQLEPMIIGLAFVIIIHIIGMIKKY